jgi:nucleoid-associated protein YgaU
MRGKFFLILLFTIIIGITGIRPALAQNSGAGINVLDLGLASDDELLQALNKASDIEFVSIEQIDKEDKPAAAPADSAIAEKAVKETTGKSGGAGESSGSGITSSETSVDYLEESRRLAKLAEEAFAEGDYDTSARYADEAAYLATQSNANVAIALVKSRLDQAVTSGVSARFPKEYKEAEDWYKQSTDARDDEEWEAAVNAAGMALKLLEGMDASVGKSPPSASPGTVFSLPATYTVRPWAVSKDCFWNIAGLPWVYGNPRQWRTLYNANKSKLPNPNNPNVIEPGTVLDIPSIKGEVRQDAWESGRTYGPLR